MKQHLQIYLTKLFLMLGTLTGTSLQIFKDLDLIFGVILKLVSIISFIIVIIINWERFAVKIRKIFKKIV